MSWLTESWAIAQPILIAFVTSVITTKATMALQRSADRKAASDAERSERLDLVRNVRREVSQHQSQLGFITTTTKWFVNPFYINVDREGSFRVRGWEQYPLIDPTAGASDGRGGHITNYSPIKEGRINDARERKEWLQFNEYGGELHHMRSIPCTHDDAHLFQPLPPDR